MQVFYDGWVEAISDARKDLKLHRIAQLLRDDTVPLDIADRMILAELLVPRLPTSGVEAVLQKTIGRPNRNEDNFNFYNELECFKEVNKTDEIPRAKMLEIGAKFHLDTYEACRSALRRGRKIAGKVAAANED